VIRALVVAIACCWLARLAWAEPVADDRAERAFAAASRLAGEPATIPQAIAAFEQLGAARPASRWTDNAWSEAGRLAIRIDQPERARAAFEQVLAITEDPVLRRRAQAALDRLGSARWDAVRRDHARWVAASLRGDPQPALLELEQLARAHPDYPEQANVWLAVARGWELEGEPERALAVLREWFARLAGPPRARLGLQLARIAIRRGELAEATGVLDRLAAEPAADRATIAVLRARIETAERRAWIRRVLWVAAIAIALGAALVLRRDAGSWRAAGRHLARPPGEALFLLPVGGVLVAVGQTGNPIVARALIAIVVAGVVATWLSGALFEACRTRRARIGAVRAVAQALAMVAGVGCVTYLAIDRDRLLDLVEETVEHGPAAR